MTIETEKKQIRVRQMVQKKEENMLVEGDVIVNDVKPDVLNIVNASGIAYVYKKEVTDGKVKLSGNINTYIMYLADGDEKTVRSLNTILDFTKVINVGECKEGMLLEERTNIKNIECNVLNSRKISVSVEMDIGVIVYSENVLDIIQGVGDEEGFQVQRKEKDINCLLGCGSTKVSAKDNISIEMADEFAEIMKTSVRIINKETKTSYNKVLSKADAEFNILYSTENGSINTVSAKIPIMGFIDVENVSDNSICETKFNIRNLIIKPNNTEMHSICVEIEVEIETCVYETKQIMIIEDMYSLTSQLNYTEEKVSIQTRTDSIKELYNIREKVNIPELNNGKLYSAEAIPAISEVKVSNGHITYNGDVELKFIFDNNGEIGVKKINLPLNYGVQTDIIEGGENVNSNIEVDYENFVVMSGGDIEVSIQIAFNIETGCNSMINVIRDVECVESNVDNIYSMVIYFVKPGDTLWKIAKMFKTTVGDIVKINDIADENVIYPNMQLYIPKYINKNVAV